MPTDLELVELCVAEWSALASLADTLDEDDWKLSTEVPGWTVQDNLVHITSIEAVLLGREYTDRDLPEMPDYVKNSIGERNERFVDSRRDWSGPEVLAEFLEVTAERIVVLRGSTEADFSAASWTPIGPGTMRDLLPFRVFDAWVHEQDMRRAVDRPGHLEGPVPEMVHDMIVAAMPFVIGKKVAPPDGTTVVIDCVGPLSDVIAIGVDNGRAELLDQAPSPATARIVVEGETFTRMACGRMRASEAMAESLVRLQGDEELGARVLDELNFLF
jgi:uncharacterized protein (TIGR03083 family)